MSWVTLRMSIVGSSSLMSIKTFLDYCNRFCTHHSMVCDNLGTDILAEFERLLDDYFNSEEAKRYGLPTAQYCADRFSLSPTCLSDMLKKETGRTASFFIRSKVIDLAKTALLSSKHTVNEIAHALGFQYPQHFTRWFKANVGCTPNEFRALSCV